MRLRDRVQGSLLAGACGDALGAPVEFLSVNEIQRIYGPAGIREIGQAYGVSGAITDDTQMTLFTAEGLIRATIRSVARGFADPVSVIHHAYERWLFTQGESPGVPETSGDGWLFDQQPLHNRRAPGNTCISALKSASRFGELARNGSKGCGGVMRVGPIGLFHHGDPERAYAEACGAAALTHGHPSGIGAAGVLAAIVAGLAEGHSLHDSVAEAARRVGADSQMHEVRASIDLALDAAQTRSTVAALGEGWVAEEALAIGLFCVMASNSLEECLILAVNHSGDSDSTGSIAGNIAGALYGIGEVPAHWLAKLELRQVIEQVTSDLMVAVEARDRHNWDDVLRLTDRYPGW